MATKRDYAAEYRRRQERARARGYRSYAEQRRYQRPFERLAEEAHRPATVRRNARIVNRYYDGDPHPDAPREGSLLGERANEVVNPHVIPRFGTWQVRLMIAARLAQLA